MFDNKKLGGYIQFLRKSQGMTQSMLAELLGVSPQAVSNWERGESMPDIALLAAIARALGTTVDRMLSAAVDFEAERYSLLEREETFRENEDGSDDSKEEPVQTETESEAETQADTETPEPPAPEEPARPEEHKQEKGRTRLAGLSDIIRKAVQGALSSYPVREIVRDKMDDINDALEEIEDAIEEITDTFEDIEEEIEDAEEERREAELEAEEERREAEEERREAERERREAERERRDAERERRRVDGHLHVYVSADRGGRNKDWLDIVQLAPFASQETLESIVENLDPLTDTSKLVSLAPFLSSKTINRLVSQCIESNGQIPWSTIRGLAPFCSHDTLDNLVLSVDKRLDMKEINSLAPFLSSDTINKLIKRMYENNQ